MAGHIALPRAQATALSKVVVISRDWTYSSSCASSEQAALHVAGPHLADPQLLGGAGLVERRELAQLVSLYLQFRAPLRQT